MNHLEADRIEVRRATIDDAAPISCVILASLRVSNAQDYSPEVIARIASNFGPAGVEALLEKRLVFVATERDRVVGTAGLDGQTVRSVFVAPEKQLKGIGRALMASVEREAKTAGVEVLTVPASVTAEPFYAKLGYLAVRDVFHGDERTIIMERRLGYVLAP
jgi:GNAT superfamily N-acetyltransferase